jgi:hypothetical protein
LITFINAHSLVNQVKNWNSSKISSVLANQLKLTSSLTAKNTQKISTALWKKKVWNPISCTQDWPKKWEIRLWKILEIKPYIHWYVPIWYLEVLMFQKLNLSSISMFHVPRSKGKWKPVLPHISIELVEVVDSVLKLLHLLFWIQQDHRTQNLWKISLTIISLMNLKLQRLLMLSIWKNSWRRSLTVLTEWMHR